MNAHSVVQLKSALDQDLQACNSDFERSMCRAIGGREIRESAAKWAAVRMLSAREVAIAQQFGYRPTNHGVANL